MPTNTFTGSGTWHTAARWSLGTIPDNGEDIVINGVCTIGQAVNKSFLSLDISAGQSLNISTYTLDILYTDSTGTRVRAGATLTIGAGGVLTTNGIRMDAGSIRAFAQTARLNNYSFFNLMWDAAAGDNSNSGIFYQYPKIGGGTAFTFICDSFNWTFYEAHIVEDASVRLSGDCYLTGITSNATEINGSINIYGYDLRIGGGSGTNISAGANSELSGDGYITITTGSYDPGVNFPCEKTSAFAFTGTVRTNAATGVNSMPAWDFSNADFLIQTLNTPGTYPKSFRGSGAGGGVLKCINFTVEHSNASVTAAIMNDGSGPFEISGILNLTPSAGSATFTGDLKLTGSSGTQSIDLAGQTIGDLILDCVGATKQINGDFTADSLSGSGGGIQSDVAGTERIITVSSQGECPNIIAKDIHMNAPYMVNGKDGGTNLGNVNSGIIFDDDVVIAQ